jgi:hypothetical protein
VARAAAVGAPPPPAPLTVAAPRTHGGFWEARLEDLTPASVRVDSTLVGARVRALGWGIRLLVPADPDRPGDAPAALAEIEDAWGRIRSWSITPPGVAVPGRGGRIPAGEAAAEVSFLPRTVREPTAVLIRDGGRAAHAPAELTPLGDHVAVETGAVPLAADFEIRLEATRPPESASRVAVFARDGSSFRYIGGRKEPEGNAWTVRTRTALPLGLFEDGTPPVLGVPRLSVDGERVRLTFSIRDRGAGLDCDGIEVLRDGRPVPQELDEERGEVVGYPGLAPLSGEGGAFDVRATDRCGNVARWSGTLRLP